MVRPPGPRVPDPGGDRAALLAELDARAQRITQLQTQHDQLTLQTANLQKDVDSRTQQIQQLQTQHDQLVQQTATMQKDLDSRTQQIQQLQTERTGLQTERTALQAQVTQLRADLDRIQTEHPRVPIDTIASSVTSLLEQHQVRAAQPTPSGMAVALRSIDLEVKGFVDVQNDATHLIMPKVGETVESNALSSLRLSFTSVPAPVPRRPPT